MDNMENNLEKQLGEIVANAKANTTNLAVVDEKKKGVDNMRHNLVHSTHYDTLVSVMFGADPEKVEYDKVDLERIKAIGDKVQDVFREDHTPVNLRVIILASYMALIEQKALRDFGRIAWHQAMNAHKVHQVKEMITEALGDEPTDEQRGEAEQMMKRVDEMLEQAENGDDEEEAA